MPEWFEGFADAIAAGDQQQLVCDDCGEGTLPPRDFCPECGSTELTRASLAERGEVLSYTEISVTTPKFSGETPYTVVLAELEPGVNLTGQLRGATAEDVAIGDPVVVDTETREETAPVITFRPPESE